MNELIKQHCVPCEGGMPPMIDADEEHYLARVPGWRLVRDGVHRIVTDVTLKDFTQNMRLVNRIAEVAEAEGHHPDITIFYNKLHLELHTHAVGGLSLNDFILAAKIDALSRE